MNNNVTTTMEMFEEAKEYWLDKLAGKLQELNIAADFPHQDEYVQQNYKINFTDELAQQLIKLSKSKDMSLYIISLTIFKIMLYKIDQKKDIIVASPIKGTSVEEYNKCVVFRDTIDSQMTFKDVLMKVKATVINGYKNQHYPFRKLMTNLKATDDVFLTKTMLALKNIHREEFITDIINQFGNNLTLLLTREDKKLTGELLYNSKVFIEETIKRLSNYYQFIAQQIVNNAEIKVGNIKLVKPAMKKKILNKFNDTQTYYPQDKTLSELFADQVKQTPENTAVVTTDEKLTYKELNERANQVARVLKDKGVTKETIVGLLVEPTGEMIVGILAILKAGGAYLPINPDYPQERIKYIFKDSKTELVLATKDLANEELVTGEIINLEDQSLYQGNKANLDSTITAANLAYVIYTSGSTGQPKGVMVEHKGVVNLQEAYINEFNITEQDNILKFANVSFDASVEEIFKTLLSGASLYIAPDEVIANYTDFENYLNENEITIATLPPTYAINVNTTNIETLRLLITAGSASNVNLVNKWQGEVEYINAYGPTENTVCTTLWRAEGEIDGGSVPIGKPIANNKVYIVDNDNNLQPIGVKGELCIAGAGLARGYLNKSELTTEKFVDNPFGTGKMYKTGDLARWLPDGNLEFLGRVDNQVQIRGHRVELEAIESKLLAHKDIMEAVVVANGSEKKYLAAYIVANKNLEVAKLRDYLADELPDYMVPAYFMQLEELPLTENGKVDKKALPEPEGQMKTRADYIAPRNKIEKKLAELWADILGVDKVGINDNFFELGGNSIKAIQVSSRLNKHNLQLKMKHLLDKPLLKEVAEFVEETAEDEATNSLVEGEVALTPIQNWFFAADFTAQHHWNQAVMLYKEDGFEQSKVRKAFKELIIHHDALRMTYQLAEDRDDIRQYNRGVDGELFIFKTVDLTGCANLESRIEAEANQIQASINLKEGPLVKLGHFKTDRGDHLLIVIHHLVVDGVSWRIILEDFATSYQQLVNNQPINLPNKSCSYQTWAAKLKDYATTKEITQQKDYWNNIIAEQNILPVDNKVETKRLKDTKVEQLILSKEKTQQLINEANQAYNTEINDILLAALGWAINQWQGLEKIVINLEGHGREEIIEDIDITRTVGWFTSQCPVLLEVEDTTNLAYLLKSVKESLRKIPQKGIGYQILKYLSDAEVKDFKSEITFNYLGQFNRELSNEVFSRSDLPVGNLLGLDNEKLSKLDINGIVVDDKLTFDINYHQEEYRQESIKELIDLYQESLESIIEHCVNQEQSEVTPSDLGDTELSLEEFDKLQNLYEGDNNE